MKVIRIDASNAIVGLNDGTTKTYPLSAFNYTPMVGDEVQVYGDGANTIIAKASQNTQQGNNGSGSQNVYVNVNQSVPGGHQVNKVAYCIIALLVGGFGIHCFYANRIGQGVCMLLFFWTGIPAIIALVQLIKALCTPADANGMIYV